MDKLGMRFERGRGAVKRPAGGYPRDHSCRVRGGPTELSPVRIIVGLYYPYRGSFQVSKCPSRTKAHHRSDDTALTVGHE
jgi:hypothetical protein